MFAKILMLLRECSDLYSIILPHRRPVARWERCALSRLLLASRDLHSAHPCHSLGGKNPLPLESAPALT